MEKFHLPQTLTAFIPQKTLVYTSFIWSAESDLASGKPAYQSDQWMHYSPDKYVKFQLIEY